MRPRSLLSFPLLALVLLPACGSEVEPIVTYTVPKEEQVWRENHVKESVKLHKQDVARKQPVMPEKSRMLALIVIDDDRDNAWFFKLMGPIDEVDPGPVSRFTSSIKFTNGVPTWKVPSKWQQLDADDPRNRTSMGRRFATILTGGDDAPELTVTKLGRGASNLDLFVLLNVNRWRKQLGLPPTTIDKLYNEATKKQRKSKTVAEVTKTEIDGKTAIAVQLEGVPTGGGGPPFMHMGR